ncbi:hypothetical protein J31TS6_18030 [Brevibacillus reuszeri]|uniref:DUF6843 domain-containing protein n=1 Tax=Brevibacillus reuszeri TaxID=54915 RepID=UPI001B2BC46C|nr:hypothetical protein [Brevibacillus reuszeri]GIO05775.1 hypothetical protein J31TS6_18030 [Brevibacillus reuszeri]
MLEVKQRSTGVVILLLLSASLLAVSGCTQQGPTNDIYLIPEGYEGTVYAYYNVKNAPPLTKEGDFDLHIINDKGYFATSTPEMDYGLVTDKYYYVDQNGQRTQIPSECLRINGTGGYSTNIGTPDEINISYTSLQVTTSKCGPDFQEKGTDENSEALPHLLNEYYK